MVNIVQCEAGEGDEGGQKDCDSDAIDDKEEQEEEISSTNTPSFAARAHASLLA